MLKFFAIALLAVGCFAAAAPVDDDITGEGVARQYRIAAEEYFNFVLKSKIDHYDDRKVRFFLYTGEAPQKYELRTEYLREYLRNSTYDVGRPTKIFIHDRLFSGYYYKELVTAYLRHFHKPVNVIIFDYSYYSGAEHKEFLQVYKDIGVTFSKFVLELIRYGTTGDRIHVLGHGVGSHIAAVAAHELTPIRFGRITGLDPAGLEFDEDKTLPQLQQDDADFVDVIVTNAGEVGSSLKKRGHVSFYPNGGVSQPGSKMFLSHLKAYFYYVESIIWGKIFEAYLADSYSDFKAQKYDRSKFNYMGEFVLKNTTGDFYLDLTERPPYSTITNLNSLREKAKFYETYLKCILGTKLAPFVFMSTDDPSYRKALTTGFGNYL